MFGIDDLSLAMLGLSAGGDIMGAFNNYQRAKQAEQIRNMLTPGGIAAGTQGILQPLSKQAQEVTGRDIAASAATTGVPGAGGGAWNQIVSDSFARLESQRQLEAMRAYINAVGGMGGLLTPQAGSTGASGDALKYLMLIRAMNQGKNPSTGQITSDYEGFQQNPNVNWGQWGTQQYDPYMNWGGGSRVPSFQIDGGF